MSKNKGKVREVPAFTVQALQKNTKVCPPPVSQKSQLKSASKNSGGTSSKMSKASKEFVCHTFRSMYERGEMPLRIEHGHQRKKIIWKTAFDQLDYDLYLPLFFDALMETKHPYQFLAEQGAIELVENGTSEKVMPSLPYLIQPMRNVLNTKDPEKVCLILNIVQKLVRRIEPAGEALVPYYRQLLPVIAAFKAKNVNIGDNIEYGQRHRKNLGDLVQETLELLESHGGEAAFINIKYLIPTYESCLL